VTSLDARHAESIDDDEGDDGTNVIVDRQASDFVPLVNLSAESMFIFQHVLT
jgi:hypothetical protein